MSQSEDEIIHLNGERINLANLLPQAKQSTIKSGKNNSFQKMLNLNVRPDRHLKIQKFCQFEIPDIGYRQKSSDFIFSGIKTINL